jgi:hypothetical protein
MVKRALLVGINYYSVPNARLNGCINDVIKVRNTLITKYGYLERNIIVLTDNQATRMPTAQNIVYCIQALVAVSGSADELFFHYSGHGSQIVDRSGDEASNRDSVILPVDFNRKGVISDDLLYQLFRRCQCPLMMIFDSCHSGTVCDLPYSFQWNSSNPYSVSRNNSIAVTNPNIFMISGCRDDQTSADAYFPATREYGGACTVAFLAALQQNNYSGSITKIYNDMCAFLQNKYTQLPILSSTVNNPTYTFRPYILREVNTSLISNQSNNVFKTKNTRKYWKLLFN